MSIRMFKLNIRAKQWTAWLGYRTSTPLENTSTASTQQSNLPRLKLPSRDSTFMIYSRLRKTLRQSV